MLLSSPEDLKTSPKGQSVGRFADFVIKITFQQLHSTALLPARRKNAALLPARREKCLPIVATRVDKLLSAFNI